MSANLVNIPYLEGSDFTKGEMNQYVYNGKPSILLLQGQHCSYCSIAKPHFQTFNDNNKRYIQCLTVQVDSKNKQDREATDIISKMVPGIRGIPSYMFFGKDGKLVHHSEGLLKSIQIVEMSTEVFNK